jgi:hypothetical protein
MHRLMKPLLALCVASSATFALHVSANPEADLLKRYQLDNSAGRDKLEKAMTVAVKEAQELLKKDPAKAARMLREVLTWIERDKALSREDRRSLLTVLQPHIDEAVLQALLHLPRTGMDVLAEYRDPDAEAKSKNGIPRAKLIEAAGQLLFSNGVESDGVVHGVGGKQVRCTLHGHRLLIPGWQLPVVRVAEGYYFFDYTLGAFLYWSNEQYAAAEKLWQAQPRKKNVPLWDAVVAGMALHGRELTGLFRQHGSSRQVVEYLERHMPALAWCCRNPRLDREIGEHLPRTHLKDKQAIRGFIAEHADKSASWQFSKQQTLVMLRPQIRAAVPNLTPLQEERLAEFILEKAEQEMQRRPL